MPRKKVAKKKLKKTSKPALYHAGMRAPRSGQYENIVTGFEVTLSKGEKFPPTEEPNQAYRLADSTQHKGGKRASKGR